MMACVSKKLWYAFVAMIACYLFAVPCSYSSEVDQDTVAELLKQADKMKTEGYYSKAAVFVEEAFAFKKQEKDTSSAELADIMDHLGELYCLAGKYAEAEPLLKESFSIRKEIFGPDHVETAKSHEHLGVMFNILGKYDQAETHLDQAYKISVKAYGQKHPVVAKILVNRAWLKINQDNREEAETILNKALEIQEKAQGKNHPDLIHTLNTLAWLHIDTDDYEKAEPFSKRALEISENTFGPEHPYVADSLDYLGRLHCSREEYYESIAINQRALSIREKFLGPEHPDVALSLNNLALPYCGLEKYETAKSLFLKSLKIREKAFGPEHPYLIIVSDNIGWVHNIMGNYSQTVNFYERSLAIIEIIDGPDNLEVAKRRKRLGELYHELGEYQKAEAIFNEALKVFEKTFGADHPRIASTLSYLASINQINGNYSKAEAFLKRTSEIHEYNFDKEPGNLILSLNNLGAYYMDLGEYEKAEPYYLRALKICEETFGPEHLLAAPNLFNLGHLYVILADYNKAESLYNRSLGIWEKAYGPEHPYVATTLDNLAIIYLENGDYEKAELLYKKALEIKEKKLGSQHPDTTRTLNNMASLYLLREDFSRAEALFQQVLKLKDETTGTESISYANSLHNLAFVYLKTGEYVKSETLYKQAVDIWSKRLGPDHQHVGMGYSHLSMLYSDLGDFEKSCHFVAKGLEIDNKLIDQVIGFTSENQKLQFVVTNNFNLNYYLNLINKHFGQDPLKRKNTLDVWLKRKGLILDVQKSFQQAGITAEDPESAKLFEELSSVRARLSKMAFARLGAEEEKNYKQIKSDLEDKKERLEAQLSRVSRSFALNRKMAGADTEQVAKVLPAGTALVDFARIESTTPQRKGTETKFLHQYITFVLHAGNDSEVAMIDLGDADKIDLLIARFKKELSQSGHGNGKFALETSKELYDIIFRPLLKDLGEVKTVFISPDGNLNLIPFEVLQQPDGRFLIEEYTFNYLAAGRDLLAFNNHQDSGQKCVFIGAPDFEMDLMVDVNSNAGENLLFSERSADLGELAFFPLPHAKAELEDIGRIMGAERSTIYIGQDALEENLMKVSGPQILHLATHGFFLGDQQLPGTDRGWGTAELPAIGDNTTDRIEGKIDIENPLLRSGILLAGAKRSLTTGYPGYYDGIVTAEKILGMNLQGTKMVVLSACDTGLGEVKGGEGVFGLRRAFTQAGAKSLVMSLWKVPDRETRELMVQFYRNINSGKMNRCQALRQATIDQIEIVRQRYGHSNPRYWGAFVFMGEP